MAKTHTLTFLSFKDHVHNLENLIPRVHTLTLDHTEVPEELLSLKDCFYHGLISDIPKEILSPFLEKLETSKQLDMDKVFEEEITICMLLDNKVLFLDMLCNSDCYADHPFMAIGKAYMMRDKLDRLFPDQKLEYLPQCQKWFEKQKKYYKEQQESKKKIETQLELLRLLSEKTSTS